jgi:hypothetical protein
VIRAIVKKICGWLAGNPAEWDSFSACFPQECCGDAISPYIELLLSIYKRNENNV